MNSRVALGQQAIDSRTGEEASSLVSSAFAADAGILRFDPTTLPSNVKKIYDASQTAWDGLVKHPFLGKMANGTASLNGFRHYLIQDSKYLEYYARVRMQSIANSESKATFEEIVKFAEKLTRTLGYATGLSEVCTTKLGVPKDVVANEPMSDQLKASVALYEGVVKNSKGDWLAMQIVLLPCIMGYYAIASTLLVDPKVVANSPYFSLWIEYNSSPSTFNKYMEYIQKTINDRPNKEWEYWIQLFQSACGTEKNFLDLGVKDIPTYKIVADKTYRIQSHGNSLFLASQGAQVTAEKNPGDLGEWTLIATSEGYTIASKKSKLFLRAGNPEGFPSYCKVECVTTPVGHWSIYPNVNGYQLLWSGQLQYALSADTAGKVLAASNYQGNDQVWKLVAV